jgi:alpha-galactosidase
MIDIINENLFHLTTSETSYVFTVGNNGELLHLYYGQKIDVSANGRNALIQKWSHGNACSVVSDDSRHMLCPDDEKWEMGFMGKGDLRSPAAEVIWKNGGTTAEFVFESYEIMDISEVCDAFKKASLPHSYDEEGGKGKALKITLKEKTECAKLILYYCVYDDCDVITRSSEIVNCGQATIKINNLASLQLDMDADVIKVTSFHGDWAREMEKCDVLLTGGKFVNESRGGNSSNHSNPFVMYAEPGATESAGEVYATNLVYSGNHRESAEFGGHAKCRILTGIDPDFLSWPLKKGESFLSPEGVLSFSDKGYRGISRNEHKFVREHIVRGEWKYKERPILLNSWEAAYFKISEGKLLKLAKEAADCGMELFVMDDGWFGKRDDDKSSLGDWYDNKEKLPNGIKGLSEKIKALGLMFGIWVEPEMVNADSDLYRTHPDWAVKDPDRDHAEGRDQMILDFSKREVREYIISQMSDVFERSNCDYVKWDMNRNFSDFFSQGGKAEDQGKLPHAYILGLYEVMEALTQKFPHILFEGCASGGNRFDLGILSYFPQIWASDDTDAVARCTIQNGYSYGYPQSTWSAHISASPNHQTLRRTPLATRFAVASMGVFGYELNLCDLPSEEIKEIKEEVEIYKKWRKILQFGDFYRLGGRVTQESFDRYSGGFLSARLDTTLTRNIIVSKDKSEAMGYIVNAEIHPNYSHTSFRTVGLDDEKLYHFCNREVKYDIRRMGDLVNMLSPIHIKQDGVLHNLVARFKKLDGETEDYVARGSLLNNAGVNLTQTFAGSGFGENTRLYADFEARMYEICEIREDPSEESAEDQKDEESRE